MSNSSSTQFPADSWEREVPRIINAAGTLTELGGTRVWPQAIQAMQHVAGIFLDLEAYHRAAGEHIAKLLGVDAAMVTSGAAAGLIQAAAACMAGSDAEARRRLPDDGIKREIIIMRSHRNPYDQALRMAGAEFVEIGNAIETHPGELEAAISERTAAVAYFLQAEMLASSLSLAQTLEVAHAQQVPVIVDAAAELPPKENLWRLAQQGCDLVLFSGGKEIRGPQTSGLIVGNSLLIQAAKFHSAPNDGVGRPLKAGKGIVAGLVAALECYLAEDQDKRERMWDEMAEELLQGLSGMPGYRVTRFQPTQPRVQPPSIPRVRLEAVGQTLDAGAIAQAFLAQDPWVAIDFDQSGIIFNTHMLQPSEVPTVLARATQVLGSSGAKRNEEAE